MDINAWLIVWILPNHATLNQIGKDQNAVGKTIMLVSSFLEVVLD